MRHYTGYNEELDGIDEFAYGGSDALRRFLNEHSREEVPVHRKRRSRGGDKEKWHRRDWDIDEDDFIYDEDEFDQYM